jgi:hypothetical protein
LTASRRIIPLTILLLILGIALGMCLAPKARAACYEIPITSWSPTGVKGCTLYGQGYASYWQGPGVARNDCVWPFTSCEAITITSLDTGRSITVTPTMYGDLYTGTANQRIVDLDPTSLKALGLWEQRDRGLFRVTVQAATRLPDTAMSR